MDNRVLQFVVCLIIFSYSCTEETSDKIFKSLYSSSTGITFKNVLTENDSLNYFTFPYMYEGGGVAVGDINNDGLLDIYFTGNQVSNKLYLNKGNLEFEDITDKAGVSGDNRWYTGVTMADVNGDGLLDIYCSVGGKEEPRINQLFLNKGDSTFAEKAIELGLADEGYSVQGTFFDYDKDGDLDLYVANYPPTPFTTSTFTYLYLMKNVEDVKSSHLYRNDGNAFTDVTEEANLKTYGLSLSATVGDLNNDSWPDLYVSNDFTSPDFMYINNKDGTFSEVVKKATGQTAFYGMGADIADINNDGFLDISQVDMDGLSNSRRKANMGNIMPAHFQETVAAGFHYQYVQNCLQINTGKNLDGVPYFVNVSRITGTSTTDWSWGPLIADFDNDGNKDLFITNGTKRDVNNNDFFDELKKNKLTKDDLLKQSLIIPSVRLDNFMYRNNGDLDFELVNDKWGIQFEGFSNGSTYADLDNDGDLEIIINNIDDEASFFENKSADKNNFVKIKFNGTPNNKFGLGNRVYLKSNDQVQMQELTLTRGFQSAVAPEIHFGLNKNQSVDEIKVVWTNGTTETLENVKANQTVIFNYENALKTQKETPLRPITLFTEASKNFPEHKHQENEYNDFMQQILLPHKMSSFGPALAIGDLNNDGLDDYFIGGSHNNTGSMFFQTKNGFDKQETTAFEQDKACEDIGAMIYDIDQDGDNDLYVVSGGYEFDPKSKWLQDRVYINNGKGQFSKAKEAALPKITTSGSKVYNADFDKDGRDEILVLGRQQPMNYPIPVKSYLLKNTSTNEKIQLENYTSFIGKQFDSLGMATSAIITDFNNDTWLDVIVVGEWMAIKAFENTKNGFKDVSGKMGLSDTTGWWWSINQGDFDNDGDLDYLIGNNGLNYLYKANAEETFDIYYDDFDKNRKKDIVLGYYEGGVLYPLRGRIPSSKQIPTIKILYKDAKTFSLATLEDIYSKEFLDASLNYKVKTFASVYLENNGETFTIHKLPIEAQLSSINQILVDDYDQDGNLDAVIAGNLFGSEVETPRNDAGYGLYLRGNGQGDFKPVPVYESGFFSPGDVKDMGTIKVQDDTYIILAKNDDFLQFIKINENLTIQ